MRFQRELRRLRITSPELGCIIAVIIVAVNGCVHIRRMSSSAKREHFTSRAFSMSRARS